MNVLGIPALINERSRFLDTIDGLTDTEFESGPTLCAGWSPRDVLAHLVNTEDVMAYVRGGLRINAVNNASVVRARSLSRADLTVKGRTWAAMPKPGDRIAARFLIGDVCVHHQDVLRGLRRTADVSPIAAGAIFREGVILSTGTKRNLLRYRVEPTTVGGRPLGRGITVRGTSVAIGLWLAGRKGLEPELEFGG
ncbi:MAG: maleylpyruvate isomerase family mycothiol-dependent enzyme [Jatrophihabitantaceae bacterium]